MAADADAPDGELSKTAEKTPSPASPDHIVQNMLR